MIRIGCSFKPRGCPGSDGETRGPTMILPHGQTRGGTRGKHVGEGPHNAPFSACTCARVEVDGLKMSIGIPQCG